jgi:hypothetical protein
MLPAAADEGGQEGVIARKLADTNAKIAEMETEDAKGDLSHVRSTFNGGYGDDDNSVASEDLNAISIGENESDSEDMSF